MPTTHRLGRFAGFGALSTILLLAACEQSSDSPTGLQPPAIGENAALENQVEAATIHVCQSLTQGGPETGYYELDIDGTVTPFSITGDAPFQYDGTWNYVDVDGPGCVELTPTSGDVARVTVTNAIAIASTGNRISTSATYTFSGFTSRAFDPDGGAVLWFKPLLEDVPDGGIEGCTPGYWKQDQHFDSWPTTYEGMDISPETLYGDVFGVDTGDLTLLEALEARGNRDGEALLRHSTAAFLNAVNGDVDYPVSAADVISQTKAAWESGDMDQINGLKDMLAGYNELGCPLN